jgi:hypothetical protein
MELSHIRKRQISTDNIENANNRDKWWNLSKLYWAARKKMGDIPLNGAGQNNFRTAINFPHTLHEDTAK